MPFPNLDPLIETFLEPTRIFLFGKPFPALTYTAGAMGPPDPAAPVPRGGVPPEGDFATYEVAARPPLPMPPGPVERALRQVGDTGMFARIYGFSFEGHYYKMPRPLLFLVNGEQARSRAPENPLAGGERAFSTRFTGIEGKDWQFANDIRVWAVDKHEIAVCLDLEIGRYEQVLLESMIVASQEEGASRSAFASRGTAMASRGTAMSSRSAASFRSAMLGPHQER